jgi:acyl transferase domain-containing protein
MIKKEEIFEHVDEEESPSGAVAIIGMAGRFPGAQRVEQYWQNIRGGLESITFFSDRELEAAGIDPALLKDLSYVRAGGVLENVDLFDATFFGFSDNEAKVTDPQQRLFLECAWEALEDAAYNPDTYCGRIGLFAGATISTYLLNKLNSHPEMMKAAGRARSIMRNDPNFLTTLISYKLNLTGPSITVQTACSTSLVAIHLACQSLLSGDCDITLAGAVSISVPQVCCHEYRDGGIHSPDGRCRSFDAAAQGTVGGSGLGLVVLKRLEDAIEDGDSIYAVIKGSAINNDGSLKIGYTAPSVQGQAAVISEALAMAGVSAASIGYVEAHGTATALGDPIEVEALTQAYRATTEQRQYCALGSVKSNIGHLDTAAGVAGLIKVALMLRHRELVPSLHYKEANPRIDFASSPFFVNTSLREWQENGSARRAGVSSFGIGGTNAHVILEEAPAVEQPKGPDSSLHLLVLSAKTPGALDRMTENFTAFLREHNDINLSDVAYTLQVGRKAFSHRRIIFCRGTEEALTALQGRDPQRVLTSLQANDGEPSIALLFLADDSLYAALGRSLYEDEPLFRERFDECAELLRQSTGRGPLDGSQPALFAIQYALGQLLLELGVRPATLMGRGVGEYVAACLAGVFRLEDALVAVAAREQVCRDFPPGELPELALKLLVTQHSAIKLNAPRVALVSSMTGTWVTSEQATDPYHWAHQLLLAEQMHQGLEELLKDPKRFLLEVGTGRAPENFPETVQAVSGRETIIRTLGHLWLAGAEIDWQKLYANEHRHRVHLPAYSFERQRYWL